MEIWDGPQLGESERFLIGKREGEALGGADGDVVGRSKRGYHLVKQTVPGLANVWIRCWVYSVDGRLPRGAKTKVVGSYAPRHPAPKDEISCWI